MTTPSPIPPPRNGEGGSVVKPEAGSPPSPARRLTVTLLAVLPWPLILFQFLLVLPRYERLFRQYGLRVDSLTQFLLDVSAWVRAHVILACQATFLLTALCVGAGYVVQGARVPRGRRLLVLLAIFGVPCALFVLTWVGVMGTHRTLVEGLKK